ncbi:hypothetical protein [Bacteroides sp.]|nr:hypothetical protein [Bacteroides sp.]MDD3039549.1 hypothetical protein [Bacteroides sp.]
MDGTKMHGWADFKIGEPKAIPGLVTICKVVVAIMILTNLASDFGLLQ